MAKVSNREDALLNAYLSRYKNAQASTVNEGQNKTQTARAKGAALLNATDKTLPVLKDTYSDTLQSIVQGASLENSLNNDVLNRQMKLAQAKFEQANDLYEQQKKAQQYAEKQAEKEAAAAAKAAAKAARSGRSSGESKSKSGSSTDSAESSEDAGAAMDALFGSGTAGTGGTAGSTNTAASSNKKDDEKTDKKTERKEKREAWQKSQREHHDEVLKAQEQQREKTVETVKNAGKSVVKAVVGGLTAPARGGNQADKESQYQKRKLVDSGRVFTKDGQVNQRYAELEEEDTTRKTAGKSSQRGIGSRIADLAKGTAKQAMGAALSFLEAPAGGGSQANKAAQYEMRRLTETGQALNADGSVSDAYQKALDQFENTKNDQDVLDEKFVPALGLVKEGNAQVQRGGEGLNGAGKAAYNIAAMGANMAPGMALGLVNPALGAGYMGLTSAGQKLAEETDKGMGSRDALLRGAASGLISTGTNAVPIGEFANITKNGSPILQGALKEGIENAGQEAADYLLNTAADYALKDPDANFSLQDMASQVGMGAATGAAFGALGGVLNRAGNRAGLLDNGQQEEAFLRKDALPEETFAQDATNMEQSAVPQNVPAAIAQPEANGTTGLAAQIQQMNAPDAANRSALNTLDELRSQVDLNGAKEKEAEQLRRAVLQRQQEIGDEAKLALQNSDSLPIDAATDTGYNDINNIGGVTNEAVQGRSQYDGTGSEGILQGSSDGTPQSGQRLAVGAESGEYLPADRVLVAEHLNQRPSVYDDSTRAIAEQAGAGAFDFRNSDDAPETFAQALATAKANNVNGAAVDGHTAEEIANIVNNGGKTFLTPDGTAGGAVEADGNLTCVFKDATNNSTPGAGSSIALAAVNGGATKGDCYGQALVNMYSKAGLEPVARIPYAYGYNDAMDAQVRKQIADGIISKEPDVYALKLRDGYDFEKAAAEFNTAHRYTQAELDALPVYDDYDEMLAYRDSLLKTPLASAGGADALPMPARADASEAVPGMDIVENARQTAGTASGQNTARPLNGSESVPENAVGATNARYSTDKIVENKDYANQAATRAVLDDAHREGLTYSKHQVWTDTEAQHQALDDINTYIQEAGGDVDKGLDNAMKSLRKDTQWDKGESVTANNIRDRLRTEYMNTEPGTPEFYRQKARYDDWQSEISKQRSKVAQTMQSFTGDATARMHEVSNPIREKWETQHSVEAARIKQLSDELDKLKTAVAQRNLDDMNSQDFTKGYVSGADRFPVQDNVKFPQNIRESIQKAGDTDAEFGQMLKDNGIPSHEERVANFSAADKEKYKTATEEAYNSIVARVKKLCEKNKVNIDDDGVKTIAGKIMNGDNAESYYNSLIMQAAGISDLSIDEMEMVDNLYSEAAKMPDSKARYEKEAQAIGVMAKHLPAKSWFERFDNIRYLAMLGNPTTHGKNIIGNILMKGLSDTKDEVAAAMQLVTTKKADRTKALYVPQDMKNAASKWIDENHYAEVVKDGGKYNLDSGLEQARSTYGQSIAGRALQKASDFNSNLLDKEDEIFVKMGATHSLANVLTARGYDASIFTKTDEASQRVLLDALETAKRDAKDVTFHTETALTRGMDRISKWGDKKGDLGEKIKYCIGQGLLPFAKTPSNILKTAAEYNPVGAAFEAGYRAYHHEGSAAVTDALAKGVVGSGVMAVGYWLAHEGFLTGTLDEDTKDYDKMLGKQEYSVNIPGVGSYTLDWAAPAIVPLMMGANLEQGGYNLDTLMQDPSNFDKIFGEVSDIFMNALDPIQNMTMMQGINNTLENIRYSDDNAAGSIGSLAVNLGTGYLQQFVPTALSKAARTVDDTRRSTYGGGSSASERNKNYLLRSTMNKIPGLSKESEPYIDQWGREEASLDGTDDSAGGMFLRGAYNFGSPGYYSAENVTPVDEYLQGLYGNTNDKHVLPEKAKNYITVDSENYYMTPEEKTEYAKTSGQTAYDIVDSLRQNDMFLQLPEDQQSALVQDAYSVAKTAGGVAAVGDGVSGVNAKEYEAYKDGGVDGLVGFMLMKNATDLVRDEKRETSGNDNADLNTVETWNTLYSQFGDDAVDNFVNSTKEDSTVRNIDELAGNKAVSAYMRSYSAVAKTLDDGQTPDKFTVGYGMQKYGLSGDDFARAYLAAYYKKDKNGKYPEKGGSYADKAGAEIYQSYGADALQDWVNYRATIPDTNGNGKADKDEAVARLKEMDLTNEMRRAYLAKTNKQWDKKNPF